MISVICPVYNEEENIENILRFFVESKPDNKELILVDGGSTDKTIGIIRDWIRNNSNIKLIENKNKYVPFALNLAIKNSIGDPIIRLDAHTIYEPDYFQRILETFEFSGADIVGGPMRKIGKTPFQCAVAAATSSSFGIGDSKIHKYDFSGESDHVYLGAWKRKLFDEIGFFDERLVRNQDDEFHYRAKSFGKKIYLSSKIKSYYYPRKDFWGLFKQYFQYGLYKPLVLKKIRSELKIRHIIPAFFVLYLLFLPFLYGINAYFSLPFLIYLFSDFIFTVKFRRNFWESILISLIFPVIHIGYGIGFILGIIKIFKKNSFEKSNK